MRDRIFRNIVFHREAYGAPATRADFIEVLHVSEGLGTISLNPGLSVGVRCFSHGAEFLAYHLPERGLELSFMHLDVASESVVDQCLVASAARCVHGIAEPLQDIVVDSDGDPGFARLGREHRATASLAEIVVLFHVMFIASHIPLPRIGWPCVLKLAGFCHDGGHTQPQGDAQDGPFPR